MDELLLNICYLEHIFQLSVCQIVRKTTCPTIKAGTYWEGKLETWHPKICWCELGSMLFTSTRGKWWHPTGTGVWLSNASKVAWYAINLCIKLPLWRLICAPTLLNLKNLSDMEKVDTASYLALVHLKRKKVWLYFFNITLDRKVKFSTKIKWNTNLERKTLGLVILQTGRLCYDSAEATLYRNS